MFDKGQEITLGANRYRLESPLSTQGGHACVWLASSAVQEGQFVVKYPNFKKFQHRTLDDLIKRANAEADLLRQFTPDASTNYICPLQDSGTVQTPVGNIPVLVLPYLSGKLPDDIKDGAANYSVGEALRWLKQIAIALRYLHTAEHQHLIHRDLKPANVLLDSEGDIRLIDLGIAKPARQEDGKTTSSMLTTQWAAPEQIIPVDQHTDGTRLFRVSTSADVYSLGLLAYYLLSQGKSIAYQAHVISRNHTNLGNQYWAEQQQQLKTWEQALTDLACLTESNHKASDKNQFITHLTALLERERNTLSPSGTLISTLSPSLPDAAWFANQCWIWVAQLLSPLPTQRPDAQQAIAYLDQALLMLQPRLDTLLMQPRTSQIVMGEPPRFTVTLQGKNLPPITRWLQVILDGAVITNGLTWTLQAPVDTAAGVNDEVLAELQLPPLQTAGRFELEVIAEVQGQDFRTASCTFTVVQTASQWWQQGNYAAAILLEPRPEWLDTLAQQLDGSLAAAFQHLQFLQEVQRQYPEQPALQQRIQAFNQCYQPTPAKTPVWVWAASGALLGAVVTFALSFSVLTPSSLPHTPQALLTVPTPPDTDKLQLQQQLEAITKERDQLKQTVTDKLQLQQQLEAITKERDQLKQTVSATKAPEPPVITPAPKPPVPVADSTDEVLATVKNILSKKDTAQYAKLPELLKPLLETDNGAAKNSEALFLMGVLHLLDSGVKGVKPDKQAAYKQAACKRLEESKALGNTQAGELYDKVKCR